MQKDSKIYVAGHEGIVGSAIIRELISQGYNNIVGRTHKELDLRSQHMVEHFFSIEKPEYVFLAAAKVGGIMANMCQPADFLYDNILIEMNVMHAAWQNNCKKLLFLGSSCIYPKNSPIPIKESYLLSSPLEQTNEAYAISKISGLKYCEYLNNQYGTKFICVMPTNLYGVNDNYDLNNSHVIPALIHKMHCAKQSKLPQITCWGDGSPLREFMFADDFANLCVLLMNCYNENGLINAGSGEEISIKDLTLLVAEIIGYSGESYWDKTKPNGTYRKLLDTTKVKNIGWKTSIGLRNGLQISYNDYLKRYTKKDRARGLFPY